MLKKNIFVQSAMEFKNIYTIAFCGIFAALAVALKFVASIDIGEFIRIGISDIPGIFVSALFGPFVGGIFWAVLDIVKYLAVPTGPFFPGFTISAMLNGIIFGCILYKKPFKLWRIFLAILLSKCFISIGLNTIWLSILYQNAILVMLPTRIITNLIMLPIDTIITYTIIKLTSPILNKQRFLKVN